MASAADDEGGTTWADDAPATLDEGAATLDGTEGTDETGGAAFDVTLPAADEATGVTFSTLSGIVKRNATNENKKTERIQRINERANERNLTGRKTTNEDGNPNENDAPFRNTFAHNETANDKRKRHEKTRREREVTRHENKERRERYHEKRESKDDEKRKATNDERSNSYTTKKATILTPTLRSRETTETPRHVRRPGHSPRHARKHDALSRKAYKRMSDPRKRQTTQRTTYTQRLLDDAWPIYAGTND